MKINTDSSPEKIAAFIKLGQQMAVGQQEEIPEEYLSERIFAAEYINHQSIPEFSLARCRVEPGVSTQLHSLSVDEWYVIESGEGTMYLGDETQEVSVGSIVQIPRGLKQSIKNTSREDLVFFCICMPRYTPESYLNEEV